MNNTLGALTILVTGASGFIGKALVHRLKMAGCRVVEMSSHKGDIANPDSWGALPAASVVVHLAGISFVPDSWDKSAEFIRVNALGTEQALRYCKLHNAHLVLASTYVYGLPSQLPISEHHSTSPNNPYALSKRIAESLCEFSSNYLGLTTTILRLFNVYGYGQKSTFLIPSILSQIKSKDSILVKELETKRDYVYIDDVVEAFYKACFIDVDAGKSHVFNIASGVAYSVRDVIDIAQKISKTSLPISSEGTRRFQEIPEVVADIALAKSILKWEPKYTLEAGLRKMIKCNNRDSTK